jgi:nitrite reductase/ring-hydroxylating ferredoxin subunit
MIEKGTASREWKCVAGFEQLPSGGLLEVVIENKVVVLVRAENEVFAYDGICPHQMARLAQGTVADDWLQCPRHRAKFRLQDGSCGLGWRLPSLRRYEARILDNRIWLSIPLCPMD